MIDSMEDIYGYSNIGLGDRALGSVQRTKLSASVATDLFQAFSRVVESEVACKRFEGH